MLAIEQIRHETDAVRAGLVRRAEAENCLDEILALDARRRAAVTAGDELRARRNQVSREIGQARSQGQPPPDAVVAEMRAVGQQINALEDTVRTLDAQINAAMLALPNLPDASTPDGTDETGNLERTVRIYRAGVSEPELLLDPERLDGEDVLPGFVFAVRELIFDLA